jgi:hypothetical protein
VSSRSIQLSASDAYSLLAARINGVSFLMALPHIDKPPPPN